MSSDISYKAEEKGGATRLTHLRVADKLRDGGVEEVSRTDSRAGQMDVVLLGRFTLT